MSYESLDARIFIGGLDLDCSEQDLEKAFGMFGDISQVMVLRDRETNVSRGFAFMSFESQDSADEAIRRMHGVEIMGRCVTVRKAERQAAMADRPRSKRGGFRGGRGGERRSDGGDFRGRPERRSSYDDDRHEARDSYVSDRRSQFDDPRGGFQSSRRGYRGSQRGFGDSRSYGDSKSFGESRSYSDSRSGNNYNGSRPMGGGYDEPKRDYNAAPRYESHRDETYGSRGYEDRYSGNNSRTEVARSRSPVARYAGASYRDESPVPQKSRRIASDNVQYRREYTSPVSKRPERGYSPPTRTRESRDSRREIVKDARPTRGYTETSYRDHSSPTRRRPRDPSPNQYTASTYTDIKSAAPERSSYSNSRRQPSPPVQKRSYSTKRSDVGLSRSGRDGGDIREVRDSRDFQSSRNTVTVDRGMPTGTRYQEADVQYGTTDRFAASPSARQLDGHDRVSKRSAHRNSPPTRSRRF
ncbi:uncharacterized protein LOC100178981 [Ciona intestinalis]